VERLRPASGPADLAPAELVIEAIVEDLDVKAKVLSGVVPALAPTAIIATNTSSLSITEIGERIEAPERTCGMHFFNPAPLMQLVEVIAGRATSEMVTNRVADIATSWSKQVARAADVPGFIVNHVARPYYLEAFRILEDGDAAVEEIDGALRRLGGFRMGPFALTDLIGQDVNAATSRSVWEQLGRPPLLTPSRLQEALVADGQLGRKTGRGVYDYGGDPAAPTPAVAVARRALELAAEPTQAVNRFVAGVTDASGTPVERYVLARVLTALILQARHARDRGVATEQDIDTAMRYGVNYPRGPFEWEREIGSSVVDDVASRLGIG
jgi:3-hydroxybutyryl-CoA dehydrogenase